MCVYGRNETTGHFADENLRTTVRRSRGRRPEIHLVSDRLWPLLRVTNRTLHVARKRALPPCASRRRSSGAFYMR